MQKKDILPFNWQKLTPQPVVGVDEVGRGCLAGPVYAAAVILSHDNNSYTDSKLISEARREILSKEIKSLHQYSIGFATVSEINELNILHAALLAMRRAVEGLGVSVGHVIVDGNQKIPGLKLPQTTVIKGDLRATPISAASIVAKVARDAFMKDLALELPEYGFDVHKGYATSIHREAIAKFGPTGMHRLKFAGVKEYYAGT